MEQRAWSKEQRAWSREHGGVRRGYNGEMVERKGFKAKSFHPGLKIMGKVKNSLVLAFA
jgi:hypothetical protein